MPVARTLGTGPDCRSMALLDVDDLQHVELAIPPIRLGHPNAATEVERRSRSALLPRRSCANLSAMKVSVTSANECLTRIALSRALAARRSASITAVFYALGDHPAPSPWCGVVWLFEAPCAIDADDAPCRCRARCEPGEQNKSDLAGFPTPRRVAVHEVGDAHAEAGDAAVHISMRSPCGAGGTALSRRSVISLRSTISRVSRLAWATTAPHARKISANVCALL